MDPFWGCGLVGDIRPGVAVWDSLIKDLQATSHAGLVATWNWDVLPQQGQAYNDHFLFFPDAQCGGTSSGAATAFPVYTGQTLSPGGPRLANLALGGNEPDQVGYCQVYNSPGYPMTHCDGYKMRANDPACGDCKCLDWKPSTGCTYDVTGCGMWPIGDASCKAALSPDMKEPFPFDCFGSKSSPALCPAPCKDAVLSNFKQFYKDLAAKGYQYASTPIVASDVQFNRDLLKAAGCDSSALGVGQARLAQGCPTHSAFHFYSAGCPSLADPSASIQDFKAKVQASKRLNADFHLQGTIVNELGSLKGADPTCPPENMSAMMRELFEYLKSDDGKGVVSQMVWFNQKEVGGTYDLRLVGDGDVLTDLGKTYSAVCQDWAKAVTKA